MNVSLASNRHGLLKENIRSRLGVAVRALLHPLVSLFDAGPGKALLPRVPGIIGRLPAGWRPRSYSLALQNLPILGIDEEHCHARACRFVAMNLVRTISFFSFETHDVRRARARARRVKWMDPDGMWDTLQSRPAMIVVPHTGDYRLAVGCIAERMQAPTSFLIPVLGGEQNPAHAAIKSLENFGHAVEVADSNDPRLAMKVARALRKGVQVIMFGDLPPNYGATHFGEAMPCRFFGRHAQLVRGVVFLASRAGHDILLAGHRIELGGDGALHVLGRIQAGDEMAMRDTFVSLLCGFLSREPENWLYLSIMEAYFHRQIASSSAQRVRTFAGLSGGSA